MSGIVSYIFFFMGIVWAIAGRKVFEVLACFLIYAILQGAYEIRVLRDELEDEEDER